MRPARAGLPVTEVPEELEGLGGETSALSAPAPRPGGEVQGSSGHIGPFLKSCLAFCTALSLHCGTQSTAPGSVPAIPARAPNSSGCLRHLSLGILTDTWPSTAVPWQLCQLT